MLSSKLSQEVSENTAQNAIIDEKSIELKEQFNTENNKMKSDYNYQNMFNQIKSQAFG